MEYKIPVLKDNYYKQVLGLLNFNLKLSKFEMNIISTLLDNGIKIVDTESRELLRKQLNKGKPTLNNYIKKLTDRNVLVKTDTIRVLKINEGILESIEDAKLTFEFTIVNDN